MRYINTKFASFVLSVFIFLTSFFSCYSTSFAVYDSGTSWWDKFTEESSTYLVYLACRVNAVVKDHDFAKWWQTREDYKEWWNTDHISRLEDSNGNVSYSFDDELVSYFKQALIEYSEETNGFYIVRTTPFSSIDPQQFTYKATYTTLNHLVNQCKLISVNASSSNAFYVTSLSIVYDNGYSFVYPSSTIDTPRNGGFAYLYDDNWTRQTTEPLYSFSFSEDTPPYGSLASGKLEDGSGYRVTQHNSYSPNYCLINHGSLYKGAGAMSTAYSSCLISNDGRNVRVFKNLDAFKLYTTNNRSVYFSKDFYESTPGEITATWDEIADSVANIDKSFQDLLDKIDSTTDESTIEDLLQQILDSINGGGGGVIGGGGSAPEHWYDDILIYLDKILKQLKSIKRWTVIDTFIDGVDAIADWLDLIHDILSDVDDGMESAVATLSSALDDATGLLKGKFPFSVPWDIFFFVTLLAAEPETPYFEVPIDFDVSAIDMHVHYDFVLDFTPYQYLSDIFRVLLSMTYAVGLLKMTAGIVSTKKEE